MWSGGSDPQDPALYRRIDALFGPEPGFEGYAGVHPVDLPGGPAITYGWVQVGSGPEGQDMPHASYLIGGPDRDAVLTCEGPDRPADHRLSIAQTLEFLPAVDPARLADPAAPWLGGRVEMQDRHFALDLPEGWVGIDTGDDWLSIAETFEFLPLGLDEVEEAVAPTLGRAEGVLGSDGPIRVELPAGPAIVVSFSSPIEGYPGVTTTHSTYLVIGEGHIGIVACGTADAPGDGWRSTVETFEFIPRRYERLEVAVAISYPLGWDVMSFPLGEDYGLMVSGIGDEGMCQLSDVTVTLPHNSDEQPFDQVLAWGLWGQFEDRVDIDSLHPSVERATRLDGPIESRYFLATDDRLVGLYCNTTPDRLPDDRWVSIAETIEFLPGEE